MHTPSEPPAEHPHDTATVLDGGAAVGDPAADTGTRHPVDVALVERFARAHDAMATVIVGQGRLLERVLLAAIAGGHLLIEGAPGLAKTRTVRTFSAVAGGTWQRVQFTPDLVPADLVGSRIWRPDHARFERENGPVHTNFLLADEINRAPAKVQSALLQAMEERQVTIGRETVALPDPFLVLATQNPLESEGTYPLPDAQTDRFMFRVRIGYPSRSEELEIVRRALLEPSEPGVVLHTDDLIAARRAARHIHVPRDIAAAVVDLVAATRATGGDLAPLVAAGAGPRGTLALCAAAQARALLAGRGEVTLGDVTDLAVDVLAHRIAVTYQATVDGVDQETIVTTLLERCGLLR